MYNKLMHLSPESLLAAVRDQYEAFPYPQRPLFGRIARRQTYPLNLQALLFAGHGSTKFYRAAPRLLVAGCGTFEACAVALANPGAHILAVDLSERSLKRLRWHRFAHGLSQQIAIQQADFQDLVPRLRGSFDAIFCTGVIHHLPRPDTGLQALEQLLAPGGVLRLMVYSRHGRRQIERIRDLAKALGVFSAKDLKKLIGALPPSHPLRIHFALYSDHQFEAGIVDGFLHACDQGFDALELRDLLQEAKLELGCFLHPVGGRPQDLASRLRGDSCSTYAIDPLSAWERVAALDRLLELETNFTLVAIRSEDRVGHKQEDARLRWSLNPVLRKQPLLRSFRDSIYSQRLRRTVNLCEVRLALIEGKADANFREWVDDLIVVGEEDGD